MSEIIMRWHYDPWWTTMPEQKMLGIRLTDEGRDHRWHAMHPFASKNLYAHHWKAKRGRNAR